ncbi:MAG: serine/threonine protein kinase, partial [Acidobacteria bacterium]
THEGAPYLVSEFLEGETLRSRLERGGLPASTAVDYTLQLVNGLAAAHERGIVHRDLKPENVFLASNGLVKILDFGLAKLSRPEEFGSPEAMTQGSGTVPGIVMGTIGYMSPEQVRGLQVDHRSIFLLWARSFSKCCRPGAHFRATPQWIL